MSHDNIQQLVSSLAKNLESNEKVATPILSAKLAKCVVDYPHDQTIGAMARIIDKMESNNTLFIRRSEFRDLYKKLYSRGTLFGDIFQEELGEAPAEPNITTYQRDEGFSVKPYQVEDQVLANALESVFDKHTPLKMYSQPLANKAMKSVNTTLNDWDLGPNNLTVAAGSDQFLVIKADYETPKGITSFYVPIEIHNQDTAAAFVFMGNAGPQELNYANIKSYVTSSAGNKLKIDATSILNVLTKAASNQREVSDTELALTRLTAKRQGVCEFSQNQIVGQKLAEVAKPDVELDRLPEADTFEAKFNTEQGLAGMQFGAEKVSIARNHIVRTLASFGYSGPQVVVTGSDKHTIFYGVSLDTGKLAFTVPVKLNQAGKLTMPTVMLCNGSISTFDQRGINQLISEKRTDNRIAAYASTLSAMRPSEVISNLRQAVSDGNHDKAEDALNVLANCGDIKAYATGFQVYMDGLAGRKQAVSQCSHVVKTAKAVSEYPICSQTGLPTNKVYQDKDGNCRPMFRKNMSETYEGAIFNNSKIFG